MTNLNLYVLLFISVFLFISCKKKIEDDHLKDFAYQVTKKKYKNSESEINLISIERDYFDKNNLLIQTTLSNKYYQFNPDAKRNYYYNNQLQLTKFEYLSKTNGIGDFSKLYDSTYVYEGINVKTKTIHDYQGKIESTVELTYDNNRLIKEETKAILPWPYGYWYEYEYDNVGRLKGKKVYNDQGLRVTYTYNYFNDKLSLETVDYGMEKRIYEHTYENNSRLIKTEKFEEYQSSPRVKFGSDQFFYNGNGQIVKEVRIDYKVSFDPPIFTYVIVYEY